jgi:hypothetical protein
MSSSFKLVCAMSVLVAASARAGEITTLEDHDQKLETSVAPSPCCGAAIIPAGHFEVEANYSGDGVRGSFVHTSNLTLKYSLTDHAQLQLSTANLVVAGGNLSARAFDGVSPGIKLVVFDQGDLAPQLAVSVHGVFPTLTIDDALQSTIDVYGMVYASKDLGPIHLDATLTLAAADLLGTIALQGGASVTATWNLTDQWGLATGPYSSFGNAERLGVDGGWFAAVNFSPFPQLALSAGAEAGFFQDTRSFSVFAGVAWVPTANSKIPLAAVSKPSQLVASR